MKTIGNILWLVLAGVWLALGWLFWALVLAITIVGLPFARQCVKLAHFSLWPFGRVALPDPTATKLGVVGAVLWFIPGLIMWLSYIISGALLCLTIIGIPFGLQAFKLAGLALAPFGKKIVAGRPIPSSALTSGFTRRLSPSRTGSSGSDSGWRSHRPARSS